MKPENLEDLLRYRVGQAHETLREAEILLSAAALRGAVNRAYYAMFYALLAVLADKQFGTSKHSSALALFDREFVKTGVFPPSLSRSLRRAFDRRQTHDYGEIIEITSVSYTHLDVYKRQALATLRMIFPKSQIATGSSRLWWSASISKSRSWRK